MAMPLPVALLGLLDFLLIDVRPEHMHALLSQASQQWPCRFLGQLL